MKMLTSHLFDVFVEVLEIEALFLERQTMVLISYWYLLFYSKICKFKYILEGPRSILILLEYLLGKYADSFVYLFNIFNLPAKISSNLFMI